MNYILMLLHLTCLYYCSGHPEVEDHHPAVTLENLCEEGGHMGPCLWTLALLNTLRKQWLYGSNNKKSTKTVWFKQYKKKTTKRCSVNSRLPIGPEGADLLGGGPPFRTGGPLFSDGGPLEDMPLKKGSTIPTLPW